MTSRPAWRRLARVCVLLSLAASIPSTRLLSFSRRQARLGQSAGKIHLSMSRQDIGDYLGLALETVSRLFSRFQDEGIINVQGRNIVLLNMECMKGIANGKGNGSRAHA